MESRKKKKNLNLSLLQIYIFMHFLVSYLCHNLLLLHAFRCILLNHISLKSIMALMNRNYPNSNLSLFELYILHILYILIYFLLSYIYAPRFVLHRAFRHIFFQSYFQSYIMALMNRNYLTLPFLLQAYMLDQTSKFWFIQMQNF